MGPADRGPPPVPPRARGRRSQDIRRLRARIPTDGGMDPGANRGDVRLARRPGDLHATARRTMGRPGGDAPAPGGLAAGGGAAANHGSRDRGRISRPGRADLQGPRDRVPGRGRVPNARLPLLIISTVYRYTEGERRNVRLLWTA